MTTVINLGKEISKIPPEEMNLYVAMRCECHSWITFYPGDVGVAKKCFICKRQWVMDTEGDVYECEITSSTRPACPYCGKHTLTGQLDREYGASPNKEYLSTKCQDNHCGEIVFLTEDWKTYNPRTKLKPCPFCGGEAQQRHPSAGWVDPPLLSCSNSGCIIYEITVSVEQWNERA